MTGPEHLAEAERLLAGVPGEFEGDPPVFTNGMAIAALAHAAIAIATELGTPHQTPQSGG